jgi:hypothetical protein
MTRSKDMISRPQQWSRKGRRGAGTYRKVPRTSQGQVGKVTMVSGKKKMLVVGDGIEIVYQKRRTEMVVGVGEGELENMQVEVGLQEQFHQDQWGSSLGIARDWGMTRQFEVV